MAESERNTEPSVVMYDYGEGRYSLLGLCDDLIARPDFDATWLPARCPKKPGVCRKRTYARGCLIEASRDWRDDCCVRFMSMPTVRGIAESEMHLFVRGLAESDVRVLRVISAHFDCLSTLDPGYLAFLKKVTGSDAL